jgi:single-strand DNA-binding protein
MITITGKVTQIHAPETFSSFTKQRVWLELDSNGKYPQEFEIEFQQDKTSMTSQIKPGDTATFHLNPRGRKWDNPNGAPKIFNTMVCWKIEDIVPGTSQVQAEQCVQPEEINKDLPF